jgi:hypothetical protein
MCIDESLKEGRTNVVDNKFSEVTTQCIMRFKANERTHQPIRDNRGICANENVFGMDPGGRKKQ